MIRVVVADDQHLVRTGLSALLDAEPDIEVVGVAVDGYEALRVISEQKPDVACVDIRMPGLSGIEVVRSFAKESADSAVSKIPILILTTFDLNEYVFGALEAGAAGFLLKDSPPDQIARAVRQIAAGQSTLDGALTRRVIQELVTRRKLQPVTAERATELLTDREREILMLLSEGMSNEEIARAFFLEVSTVKSHLSRMLPKIGVKSRLQAVVWAYQNRVVVVPGAD